VPGSRDPAVDTLAGAVARGTAPVGRGYDAIRGSIQRKGPYGVWRKRDEPLFEGGIV